MKKWFQPEIDFLTRNYKYYSAKELGELLHFSENAVRSMASKLGLRKSKEFRRNSMARARLDKQMSFHDRYIIERLRGDWSGIQYTTRATSLGGAAEEYFHRLVPEAIDANRDIKINNPDFDFIYKDLKIDVKFSSAHKRNENWATRWGIRCTGNMDLIVGFLERSQGEELENPYIIVIDKALMPKKKIEISKNGRWGQLFIEESELVSVLDKYSYLKNCLIKNCINRGDNSYNFGYGNIYENPDLVEVKK